MLPRTRPATASTRSQRVHELGLKLVLLLVVAAAAFLLTRRAATWVQARVRDDAARMHDRGVAALRRGDIEAAVTPLRRAVTEDRRNPAYALTYAQALRSRGQLDAAERALLRLRTTEPDDPVVNLELARVAADRHADEMALRYYTYALYSPWPEPRDVTRVREELVTYLLRRGERTRAVAELMAARATTADDPAAHRRLADLFLDAGDDRLALDEYRRALRLDPGDTVASRGAGHAAFRLGDYRLARSYLEQSGATDADAVRERDIARAVLTLDPLATRLPAASRLDRVRRVIGVAADVATACSTPAAPAPGARLQSLERDVRRSRGRDVDVISDTVAAAADEIQALSSRCDVSAPAAQAVLVLGRREQEAR